MTRTLSCIAASGNSTNYQEHMELGDQTVIQSLVCDKCWKTLFDFKGFQQAWESNGSTERLHGGFTYSTAWSQLTQSSSAGCAWCRLLIAEIPEYHSFVTGNASPSPQQVFKVKVRFKPSGEGSLPASLTDRNTLVVEIEDSYVQFYEIHTDIDDAAARYITAREMMWQVSSPATFVHASRLITECVGARHPLCPSLRASDTALPTRVIDCADTAKPKVYATANALGVYVALSYVWGENQPYRTQTSNIEMYKEGIDLDQIPQTIRDAIQATQLLGFRYLWVDSLCIIQDSKEDKNREIPQIRKTFQNAVATIIAASSCKVSDGFLQDRPAPPPAIRLPFLCPDSSLGSMWIRGATHNPPEAVDTRAWCYEERLLSPRVLVFASNTVRYECRTQLVNVGHSNRALFSFSDRLPESLARPDQPTPVTTADVIQLTGAWDSIVAEYTKRDLTHPRDKLIAFYGISETFQQAWKNSKYLAGLWSHRLLEELLWMKTSPPRYPRPEKFRAPSWSWAAIDGPVVPGYSLQAFNEDDPECEILECDVTLKNTALPFGEVTGGFLRLSAAVNEVMWDPLVGKIFMPTTTRVSNEEKYQDKGRGEYLGICEADCEEALDPAAKVWAVPLRSTSQTAQMIEGLLVVRDFSDNDVFCRVGAFQIPTGKPRSDIDIATWLAVKRRIITIV